MATASQMLAKAKSQVGVTEKGHSNVVKYNDWYWGKGKYGSWAAWCSVFLCWCSDQLGMKKNVDYPYSAGVAVCFSWFRAKGRIISKHKLKPGDWCRFTFSHVGLVREKPSGGTVKTIEGNTSLGSSGSQRDGGGVWLRTRPLSLIQYGGRPNYSGSATASAKPATPVKKKGIFGMTLKANNSRTENRKVAKGKEVTLRTHAKDTGSALCSVKKGETILVDGHLRLSGLREGQVAEVYYRLGEYVSKTKKSYTRHNYARQTVYGRAGGGDVHVSLPLVDKVAMSPKHGGDLRLYAIVKNVTGDNCVAEYVSYKVLGD